MKLLFRDDIKLVLFQFVQFGIVGLSNTVISYLVYSLLVFLGLFYIFASIIAFVVSVLNSFFWNNKYVFKKNNGKDRSNVKSLIRTFISYGLSGLLLQNILLFVLIDIFEISKYIAPVFCLLITVPLNFILNKFWVFRPLARIETT